jgi:hypothetical protein
MSLRQINTSEWYVKRMIAVEVARPRIAARRDPTECDHLVRRQWFDFPEPNYHDATSWPQLFSEHVNKHIRTPSHKVSMTR